MNLNVNNVNPRKGKTLMILGTIAILAGVVIFLIQKFAFIADIQAFLLPAGLVILGIVFIILGKMRHWMHNE